MMFSRNVTSSVTCLIVVALLVMGPAVFAEDQKVKAVFDFRVDNPEVAVTALKGIHQTYTEKPDQDFVVIFMGNSSKILSTNREGATPEDQKFLDEIAATIAAMEQDGIKLEVCDTGAGLIEVDPASILSEIAHAANGWAALIGYELDGYAPVAVF